MQFLRLRHVTFSGKSHISEAQRACEAYYRTVNVFTFFPSIDP